MDKGVVHVFATGHAAHMLKDITPRRPALGRRLCSGMAFFQQYPVEGLHYRALE